MRVKVRMFCGWPLTRTSPVDRPAVLRPARTSMNVVLPAPLAPARQGGNNDPLAIVGDAITARQLLNLAAGQLGLRPIPGFKTHRNRGPYEAHA